jgi:hypothetical protein
VATLFVHCRKGFPLHLRTIRASISILPFGTGCGSFAAPSGSARKNVLTHDLSLQIFFGLTYERLVLTRGYFDKKSP